jgi:hypothetical protein
MRVSCSYVTLIIVVAKDNINGICVLVTYLWSLPIKLTVIGLIPIGSFLLRLSNWNALLSSNDTFTHRGSLFWIWSSGWSHSMEWTVNDHKYVTRTQIPLMLSFATTIHKVQGLTFPNVACDMEPSIFTGGIQENTTEC